MSEPDDHALSGVGAPKADATHAENLGAGPAIRFDRVSFAYRPADAPVVVEADGAIAAGVVTGLLGPNAAGKSTLLKLAMGLLTPCQGGVWLGVDGRPDRSVSLIRPAERARWLSYVPQRPEVAFGFTVREVVAMGGFAWAGSGLAAERADAVLADHRLSHLADRPLDELSGGQQQRATLARAFVQATWAKGCDHVMLLDEPVSAMDLSHQHETLDRLQRWVHGTEPDGARRSAVVVLHDLSLAARYCDRVLLMDAGRFCASGPAEAVLAPSILEPLYGVGFERLKRPGDTRAILVSFPR